MQYRARPHRQAKRVRSAWWAIGVSAVVLIVSIPLAIRALPVEAPQGSSPILAATPSATPTATPSATPTPTPTPVSCTAWQFPDTHLSIPSVGIEGRITEYTPQERINNGGQIIPPEKMSIIWDSWFCRQQNILSIPSAQAEDCIYLGGHSYKYEPAAFNSLIDMPVGAAAVLTSADGSTATYIKEAEEITVPKATQQTDERLYPKEYIPGCLKLITCQWEGDRDGNGNTLNLRVTTLMLRQSTGPTTP